MFESLVAGLLGKYLGEYFTGFDADNLNIGIWGGDVRLEGLEVKRDALADLNLPVTIYGGYIGSLVLHANWTSLGSEPVRAEIDRLFILAGSKEMAPYDPKAAKLKEAADKKAQLDALEAAKEAAAHADEEEKVDNSFTARLIAKIIDNLQVEIKNVHIRYEDSLGEETYAAGITLERLSAQSTDENWEPKFLSENAPLVHKLVSLRNLAIYFDTSAESLRGLTKKGFERAFQARIQTDRGPKVPHNYIMEPVSGDARIILSKRDKDFSVPKVFVELGLEAINFALAEKQYADLMELLGNFSAFTRSSKYRKFRPNTAPGEDPAGWWRFAIQCVKDDIHQKAVRWSPAFFAQRRHDRLEYIRLWRLSKTKKIKKVDKGTLAALEDRLSFEDIRYFRSLAEREIRREEVLNPKPEKTGWFGGWFGGKDKKKKKDGPSTSEAGAEGGAVQLTEEQLAYINSEIGFNPEEAPEPINFPEDYEKMVVNFSLRGSRFTLVDHQYNEIMRTQLSDMRVNFIQRPTSMKVNLNINSFEVHDCCSPDTLHPRIVYPKDKSEATDEVGPAGGSGSGGRSGGQRRRRRTEDLLAIEFEQGPLDHLADSRVRLRSRPLNVVFNGNVVNRILHFFVDSSNSMANEDLYNAATSQVSAARAFGTASLQHAIDEHKTLDIDMDVQSPLIIIPQDCTTADCPHLVVDLGRLVVQSELTQVDAERDRSLVNEDDLYDRMNVYISEVQILVSPVGTGWRNALTEPDPTPLHLLEKLSLDLRVEQCVVMNDPLYENLRVSGALPSLRLDVDTNQLLNLMAVVDTITEATNTAAEAVGVVPEDEAEDENEDGDEDGATLRGSAVVGINNTSAVANVDLETALTQAHEEKKKANEAATGDLSVVGESVFMRLNFEIQEIAVKLRSNYGEKDDDLLLLTLRSLQTEVVQRQFDTHVSVSLHRITGKDLFQQNGPAFENMIASSLEGMFDGTATDDHPGDDDDGFVSAESEEAPAVLEGQLDASIINPANHLIAIDLTMIQKDSPIFRTVHDSTLMVVGAHFRELHVQVNPETVAALLTFAGEAFPPKPKGAETEAEESDGSIVVGRTAEDIEAERVARAERAAKKRAKKGKRSRLDKMFATMSGQKATQEEMEAAAREADRVRNAQRRLEALRRGSSPHALAGVDLEGLSALAKLKGLDKMKLPGTSGRAADENDADESAGGTAAATTSTDPMASSTLASSGGDEWFSCENDEYTLKSMRVAARLDALSLTINRPGKKICRVAMEGVEVAMTQFTTTMHLEAALDKILVQDLTESGKEYRNIVDTAGTDPLISFEMQTFNHLEETGEPYPGYNTSIKANVQDLQVFFLNRFVGEMTDWAADVIPMMTAPLNKDEGDEAAKAAAAKKAEEAAANAPPADPEAGLLSLDIKMANLCVYVPQSSASKEVIKLDLGRIVVGNKIKKLKDKISVDITGMRLSSGTRGVDATFRDIIEPINFEVKIKRSLDTSIHDVEAMSVEIIITTISVSLTRSAYATVMALQAGNMTEISEAAQIKNAEIARTASNAAAVAGRRRAISNAAGQGASGVGTSSSQGGHHHHGEADGTDRTGASQALSRRGTVDGSGAGDTELHPTGPAGTQLALTPPPASTASPAGAANSGDETGETWTTMLVLVALHDITLKLVLEDEANASAAPSTSGMAAAALPDRLLAQLTFDTLGVNFEQFNDGSMSVDVGLKSIDILDCRPDVSKFPNLLSHTPSPEAAENELSVEFAQDAAGAMDIKVVLDRPRGVIVFDSLYAILDFVQPPEVGTPDSDEASAAAAALAAQKQQVAADAAAAAAATADPYAKKAPISVQLNIVAPEFILVEDPASLGTRALVLDFDVAVEVLINEDGATNVRALIEHMEIFKCYLARREETLQFIVEPFTLAAEVNLENNRETGGADTDVTVDLAAIDIRVSYQDVLLALAILNTMTPPAAAEAVKSGDSDAPAIEDAPAKTVAGQTSAGAEAEAAADAKGKGHAGIVRMDSSDFDLAEDELAAEAEAEAERAKTALRLAEAAEVAAVSVDDLVVDQYGSIRDADGTELLVPNEPAPANVETLVLSTGFIRLILINDRYPGQSTPLLNFRITSINVGAEAWSSALTVRAQLSIASDYYNPKLAVWEPMIEAETPEAIREQLRAARAAEYADGLPAPEDEAALADPDGESDEEAFGGSKGWSLQVDLATVAEPKVHQQIGVISTQVLNLNVTHTFMETLYLTTYLLGADYSKMQAAQDSLAPEDMFMPYKLVNLTGHKLRFWLSSEDFYQVRSWEEQKFDYRDSAVVTAGVRSVGIDNPHYIVVQVAGGWDPVVRVPIDVVGTRAYTLQPLQDADQRLICDVELVDFVKVITVRTGVRMKNQTKMPLEVRLDVPNGPSRALPVLAPGSVSCVPITMAMMAHVRVRPVDGWHWSDEDTHWAEYEVVDDGTHDATATATRNKALGVQFMSCRAKGGADRNLGGGGGAGAMVASRSSNSVVDEGAYSSPAVVNSDAINVGVRISADFLPNPAHFPYPSHTYTFFTPLILENGLATGINVTLSQEAGTTRTGVAVGAATFDDTLASGAAVEVCELNLNHRITISVENDEFSCEEPALLFAARSGLLSFGANADKSMTLVNRTDGRELKINIERTLQDDGSQKVTVYAPFWIYNKTPFNLAYAETSLTSKTVAAGVPAEGVAPSSATPFQFFKTKAAIRVGGVEEGGPWSKSVSLAGAGTTGVLEVKGLGGEELPPAEPAGAGPSDGGAGVDGEAPAEEAPAPAKKDNKKKKKKKAADAVPLHEFSVSVELGTDAFRLVKKVTIENRYVFVNRTAEPMAVMQSGREEIGDDGAAAVIAPGASLPFSWPSIEADRLVRIKFAGGEYDWSGAVDPSEVGFSNVKLRALDGFGTYIVNAEVKLDGGVTYVVLAPSSANPPIRIVNQTGLPLTYKQCGMDDLAATLEAGAATDYVWDDLSATRRLRCVFPLPEGLSAKQARKEETEYNLNDFAVKDDWILRTGEVIKVRVYPRGPTRVIRFRQVGVGDFGEIAETDADKAARKAKEKSKGKGPAEDDDPMKAHDPDDIRFAPNIVVHATLAGIGLSIIDSKPRELLYVSLLDFDVGFMDSDWSRMIELKLKSLQIDNQMSLVQFPVMLCPTPTKIGDKPFLHLSVNIDNRNTTIDFYHYVGFMMQELDLKVEESLLMALLDFVWSMPQPPAADKPDAADGDGDGGESDGGEDGEAGAAAVTATPDSALSRQLYGDLIMLNPIQVNVSFATSPTTIEEVESGSSSSNPIAYIVRTLGVTLANIDNAPLKLNALVLENVFATQDELVGKIVHHYTMQGIRESYKILGSLDFLGNPVGLFNNVSTGVKDFFYEPAQGMVSSPAEFGRGLGRGTASLLKNTVSGIFNTTSKLTGTVSKGLGMLSFDEEYKMEREQNATHKPEHVGEGLMMGAKDLGKGVFDGVTGVFTQPIKGAKSGGVGGFFKGVGKGLVGVAVKPVAGVVDLATRTSEGIKNTATYFDAKAARVRLPRYFASDKVLRRFSTEAALGQYVLYQVKSGRYILTDYYVAHAVMAGHKGKRAILLSTKHLMEVNVADASARWIIPLTAITGDINIYAGGFVVFSELTRARGVGVVSAGGGSVKERELCLAETTRSAWFARLLETARQAQLIALEEGGGTIAAALEAHAERMANHPDDPVPGTSMGGGGVGGSGVGGSGVGGSGVGGSGAGGSGAGVGQP